jgi:hypothetical protein
VVKESRNVGHDGRAALPPFEFVGFAVQVDLPQIAAMDLFVVPTIGFNLLYALVISSCWARRIRKLRQRRRTSDSVVHL